MAYHVELHCCALSDRGLVRARNEDAIAVLPELGVAILADGMGGYRAGEVASRIAVEVCTEMLATGLAAFDWSSGADRGERLDDLLRDAGAHANAAIHQAGRDAPQHAGMGTTLVMAYFHHDKLIVAHVGDSRAYRMRDGRLDQITRDHSQVQDYVDAGLMTREQARLAPNRNLVTRAMGIDPAVDIELGHFASRAGDVYLLCSDGLSDMLDDREVAAMLDRPEHLQDRTAADLVARANAAGGTDNISVVLVRIDTTTPECPEPQP